jgi:hypothetical protein
MATDPNKIQLTDEQRRILAQKAAETGRSVEELLDELLAAKARPRRQPRDGRSLLDAMREHGMVGAMQGPGDLSTNPKYMEGFGKSRGGTDTH